MAAHLGSLLGLTVPVSSDWQQNPPRPQPGEVVMLQNVRVNKGEKKNNAELGQAYAALCDIYVNDAFGTAHRAEASLVAVAEAAPAACAGILLAAKVVVRNLEEPGGYINREGFDAAPQDVQ